MHASCVHVKYGTEDIVTRGRERKLKARKLTLLKCDRTRGYWAGKGKARE